MMSRKLVMFIKFLFKVGVIVGIFRFNFDKNTGQFVKLKCLSIYNFFVWTIVILYTPYEFYNAAIVEIQFAGSDQNGIFLIAVTYIGVFSTLYLSTLIMFYCLHFARSLKWRNWTVPICKIFEGFTWTANRSNFLVAVHKKGGSWSSNGTFSVESLAWKVSHIYAFLHDSHVLRLHFLFGFEKFNLPGGCSSHEIAEDEI